MRKKKKDNVRLACQVKVKQNLSLEIPEEIFAVKRYKAKVKEIQSLTHDTKRVLFELSSGEIDYKAGQFVQIVVPAYSWKRLKKSIPSQDLSGFKKTILEHNARFGHDRSPTLPSFLAVGEVSNSEIVERAYSMSSDPTRTREVEVIVRHVPGGVASTYVNYLLKEGDDMDLVGPFGDFYVREEGQGPLICVAGGSGLAPFKSIFTDFLPKTQREMWFFFGARILSELYYVEEMKALEKEFPHFHYVPCVSNYEESQGSWDGEKTNVAVTMEKYLKDIIKTDNTPAGYLCGSPGMIDACSQKMNENGIEEIYYDKFT